jgi:hypothetical protein
MSIENVVRNRVGLLERVGKIGLNIQYPDEFELYVIALELLDSELNTLRYFIFPVMPESLEESYSTIQSIKKTLSGLHVQSTSTFTPTDITLSGSFGRRLRVLLGTEYTDFLTSFKAENISFRGSVRNTIKFFDENIKTGYGCIKILEKIIKESSETGDDGRGKLLVLHNLALGNSYVVRPINLRLSQNKQSNMIWNYSLSLKSIAPLESLYTSSQMRNKRILLGLGNSLQGQLDTSISFATRYIAKQDASFRQRVERPIINKFKEYLRGGL